MIPTVNVTVKLHDQNGEPVSKASVYAKLTTTERYNGYVVEDTYECLTDEDGIAVVAVFPNELGSEGSEYKFTIVNPSGKKISVFATIPNHDCDLHQVCELEPYEIRGSGQIITYEILSYAQRAEKACSNAQTSEFNAQSSSSNANIFALNASISENNAHSYSDLAQTYSQESLSYKISAENSASLATSAANLATSKAEEAFSSASTATTKASDALVNAGTATQKAYESAESATSASTSAITASTKATEASTSAATATTKASAADTSAKAAKSSETEAATSASTASTKATEASASATSAAGSAASAQASKEAAASSKSSASASASTATTKANEAKASASTASTKATEASASATSAAASAAQAQGYVDTYAGLTAEAATLAPGSAATAEFSAVSGKLTLGVPRGDVGPMGPPVPLSDSVTTDDATIAASSRAVKTVMDAIPALSDALDLNSSTTAASAKAVKNAYDTAGTKMPISGGVFTGEITSPCIRLDPRPGYLNEGGEIVLVKGAECPENGVIDLYKNTIRFFGSTTGKPAVVNLSSGAFSGDLSGTAEKANALSNGCVQGGRANAGFYVPSGGTWFVFCCLDTSGNAVSNAVPAQVAGGSWIGWSFGGIGYTWIAVKIA